MLSLILKLAGEFWKKWQIKNRRLLKKLLPSQKKLSTAPKNFSLCLAHIFAIKSFGGFTMTTTTHKSFSKNTQSALTAIGFLMILLLTFWKRS